MDANQDQNISIIVNGEPARVPAGLNLRALLKHLGIDGSRVAVELDRTIVRKTAWADTPVGEGSRLEIVHFVGGG